MLSRHAKGATAVARLLTACPVRNVPNIALSPTGTDLIQRRLLVIWHTDLFESACQDHQNADGNSLAPGFSVRAGVQLHQTTDYCRQRGQRAQQRELTSKVGDGCGV
jgi:hypothetical protein